MYCNYNEIVAEIKKRSLVTISVAVAQDREVLAIGDTTNQKGYYAVVVTDESKCIGCAMCGVVCPDVALEVSREKRS